MLQSFKFHSPISATLNWMILRFLQGSVVAASYFSFSNTELCNFVQKLFGIGDGVCKVLYHTMSGGKLSADLRKN